MIAIGWLILRRRIVGDGEVDLSTVLAYWDWQMGSMGT